MMHFFLKMKASSTRSVSREAIPLWTLYNSFKYYENQQRDILTFVLVNLCTRHCILIDSITPLRFLITPWKAMCLRRIWTLKKLKKYHRIRQKSLASTRIQSTKGSFETENDIGRYITISLIGQYNKNTWFLYALLGFFPYFSIEK